MTSLLDALLALFIALAATGTIYTICLLIAG